MCQLTPYIRYADMKVAFVSGGRARPIPKALRIAMKADQDVRQDG